MSLAFPPDPDPAAATRLEGRVSSEHHLVLTCFSGWLARGEALSQRHGRKRGVP